MVEIELHGTAVWMHACPQLNGVINAYAVNDPLKPTAKAIFRTGGRFSIMSMKTPFPLPILRGVGFCPGCGSDLEAEHQRTEAFKDPGAKP